MKHNNKFGKLPKYNNGMTSTGTPWGAMQIGTPMPNTLGAGKYADGRDLRKPITGKPNNASTNRGNIVGDVTGFASSMANVFADPTISATNTYTSGGPIKYAKTDYLDLNKELDVLGKQNTSNTIGAIGSGASLGSTVGSIIPGVGNLVGGAVGALGGAIAGIFGGSSRKSKLKQQIIDTNKNISNKNTFNLADAHSDMLEQAYYDENENTQDDRLYNKGKTPFVKGKSANALVGKGETIVDGKTGEMTEVTSGSAIGTDDVQAFIKPSDAIAGNKKNPRTGNTFADDMKPLTRMENKLNRNNSRNIKSIADNTQKLVMSYTKPLADRLIYEQASVLNKRQSVPEYNLGKVGAAIGKYAMPALNTIGTIMPSIYNSIQGSGQPDTVNPNELYSQNNLAAPALSRMSKRRYNNAPEIDALTGLERRNRYNARAIGSEGGINRAMDVAGAINTSRQISNSYAKKQNIDNDYMVQEAGMMAQLGAQEAANRSNAMKSAYDINSRNKATKTAYKQAGLQGFANYAQQQTLNANRNTMDDARLRVLENYYKLGTTDQNAGYIFNSLINR